MVEFQSTTATHATWSDLWLSWKEGEELNVIKISDKSTSDDDEETGIDKEGVEIVEEAENVSKGTKNDDKMIANTHIVIFTV